jgi:NAD(P)-dependent dehydrogenase (short-subunit alcohol dehydrogenase family)
MITKTAFITGAATGIGRAITEKLDQQGWRVFAGYNSSLPAELLNNCSERVVAIQCEVLPS